MSCLYSYARVHEARSHTENTLLAPLEAYAVRYPKDELSIVKKQFLRNLELLSGEAEISVEILSEMIHQSDDITSEWRFY